MFVVFEDEGGEYRWHLAAENGEVICQSEAYPTPSNAVRGVEDAVAAFSASIQPDVIKIDIDRKDSHA